MYDFEKLLQPQIDLIIQTTRTINTKLLDKLQRDYANELMPGHQPKFWDPYKDRHREKVSMAHTLHEKLQKGVTSLHDIEEFIVLFERQTQRNHEIDPKGGRYGRILGSQAYALEIIHGKILQIHRLTKNENYWKCKIIRHLMTLEKETLLEGNYKFKAFDLKMFKGKNDYHRGQIKVAQDQLINLHQQAAKESHFDMDKTTFENNVESMMKEIQNELDKIEYTFRQDLVRETEIGPVNNEKIYKAKITFLQQELRTLEDKQLSEEIFQASTNIHKLSDLDVQQKVKIFTFTQLLNQFCEAINLDQKQMFWDFVLSSINDYGSYLNGVERKLRRDAWYKGCYSQRINEKETGIPKKDILDPLNITFLTRELKSLDFEVWTKDELIKEIEDIFTNYFNKYLNEAEVDTDQNFHKILVYREWQKELKVSIEQFKDEITKAFTFIEEAFQGKELISTEKKDTYLPRLIALISKQLDPSGEITFKANTVSNSFNSGSPRLFRLNAASLANDDMDAKNLHEPARMKV